MRDIHGARPGAACGSSARCGSRMRGGARGLVARGALGARRERGRGRGTVRTGGVRSVFADERGISIVFAMLLLVVLLIVGGIIVSYAYSGYERAQQDAAAQRSAYNVESAADLAHDQFSAQAAWAMDMLQRASSNGDQAVDETLSVQPSDSGVSFADVTVRVKHTTGISYDVACFEADAVDENGNVTGAAEHFVASYSGGAVTGVGDVKKVGQ